MSTVEDDGTPTRRTKRRYADDLDAWADREDR